MSNPTDEDALRARWTTRGVLQTELVPDEGGTLSATGLVVEPASWTALIETLPQMQTAQGPLVELQKEIGRGGMGVVHSARQRSLGRNVAAKSTLGDATAALLREAWICGNLEHPNVIPVYELYRGADQKPVMVMKHVEGKPWSEVLRESSDREAQLRILVQLCHTVHYAHIHGFVHLDLKPDNVMIGSFGEMYLLDWGVAASTSTEHPPFIPRARDIRRVLGTPAYMAPELAEGDGGSVGPATDVYLLGAILFEILTGAPPHQGETLMECIVCAFSGVRPACPRGFLTSSR